MTSNPSSEISRILIPFFEGEGRILAAYLLGSAVSGRLRPDSDIDVALLPYPSCRLSDLDRANLGARIAFEIGREVDIGELCSSNLIYAKEAIFTGLRIFSRDARAADESAATLLGLYVAFNEERREVLDAYRA
jgi:predicted nucleotidyltransferase